LTYTIELTNIFIETEINIQDELTSSQHGVQQGGLQNNRPPDLYGKTFNKLEIEARARLEKTTIKLIEIAIEKIIQHLV
jgi:hypothetical protein